MGADSTAHSHGDDRSQYGVPSTRIAATFWGANDRLRVKRSEWELFILSTDVQPLRKCQQHTHSDTWLPAWRRRGWLRQPAEHLALERRPRAGPDRPSRLQHQRERYGMASFPVGHRPASRIHGSHQSSVQCAFAATSLFFRCRTHARFLAEPGELLQPGVLVVRKLVWAEQPSEDPFGFPNRIAG